MTFQFHDLPDAELHELLETIEGEQALMGPDREDVEHLFIDDLFAKSFDEATEDFLAEACAWSAPEVPLDCYCNAIWERSSEICHLEDGSIRILDAQSDQFSNFLTGVIALHRSSDDDAIKVIGMFTGCTLCVDPEHRGAGIGKALVKSRLLLDGWLPTWEHDKPAYSPGGAATIISAVRELSEMLPPPPSAGP